MNGNRIIPNKAPEPLKYLRFLIAIFVCCLWISGVCAGNIQIAIEELPQKQPTERVQICLSMFQDRYISPEAKNQFIKVFAQDVRNLSQQYGESAVKIDPQRWIDILSEGLKAFPEDQNIVFALTIYLINERQYKRALQVIEPFHAIHPSHETTAWIDYCSVRTDEKSSQSYSEESLDFDIHFCILADNPEAHKKCTIEQLKREALILNHTFVTLNQKPLLKFHYKSASFYDDIQAFHSPLEQMTNNKQSFDSNQFNEYYNQCRNPKIRDTHAINFYIYDSYDPKTGDKDITSHGRRNSNMPYILIDWERLNNNIQNPEAHEMGHAFGLGHIAVPNATIKTPTNIMCSTEYGFGSGGTRQLGFTEAQTAIILYHAKRTKQRLNASEVKAVNIETNEKLSEN